MKEIFPGDLVMRDPFITGSMTLIKNFDPYERFESDRLVLNDGAFYTVLAVVHRTMNGNGFGDYVETWLLVIGLGERGLLGWTHVSRMMRVPEEVP